jgi:hypothetical protein
MNYLERGELQALAQSLLRSNNIELGDDPRDEITVAQELGYLTIQNELES